MIPQICRNIVGWFPPPQGYPEIVETYGAITVEGDQITTPKWESLHMKSYQFPLCKKPLYVNKAIIPMLEEALGMCEAIGGYELRTIGCFAPRAKRSNKSLSLHSWGVAVDINADTNPALRIKTPADLDKRKRDIPDEWVEAFKSIGWTWGGDFSSFYDPMHFQWATGY